MDQADIDRRGDFGAAEFGLHFDAVGGTRVDDLRPLVGIFVHKQNSVVGRFS